MSCTKHYGSLTYGHWSASLLGSVNVTPERQRLGRALRDGTGWSRAGLERGLSRGVEWGIHN